MLTAAHDRHERAAADERVPAPAVTAFDGFEQEPRLSPTTCVKAPTGVIVSAISSRHTGTTRRSDASSWNLPAPLRSPCRSPTACRVTACRLHERARQRPEEARTLTRVARSGTLLVDDHEQRVTVAVVSDLADELTVSRRLSLAPVLLAAAAPEPRAPGRRVLRRASESM